MESENRCYIYRHVRLDTNTPFYIGIGTNNNNYKRSKVKSNRSLIWKRIISKSDYRIDILMEGLTWDEACEKEKEFIAIYGRRDLKTGVLVNKTDGGDGCDGILVSSETRKKISTKISGDNHWTTKKQTPLKGGKLTDEHILKLKSAWVKRKELGMPLEVREKISQSMMGEKHKYFGKKKSKEVKDKISKSSSGINSPFLKYEIDVYKDNVYLGRFNGGGEVAKAFGFRRENVYDAINHKRVYKNSQFTGYSFNKILI